MSSSNASSVMCVGQREPIQRIRSYTSAIEICVINMWMCVRYWDASSVKCVGVRDPIQRISFICVRYNYKHVCQSCRDVCQICVNYGNCVSDMWGCVSFTWEHVSDMCQSYGDVCQICQLCDDVYQIMGADTKNHIIHICNIIMCQLCGDVCQML